MGWKQFVSGGLALFAPAAAFANFHLVSITEVFAGTAADPNVQYIEMQMYAGGQNVLGGHRVFIFNEDGSQVTTINLQNVAGGANQDFILLATTQAEALFGVEADFVIDPVLIGAAGSVCFGEADDFGGVVDCVAWGDYTGAPVEGNNGNDTGPIFGTPFNQGGGGITPSLAMQRRIDTFGNAERLEEDDDTNNCAADFFFNVPNPTNNAGTVGIVPPSNCGDGILDGVEQCDDGANGGGDGCEDDCTLTPPPAVCGNAALEEGEACDDGNTAAGDGCDAVCALEENLGQGRCSVNPSERSLSTVGMLGLLLGGLALLRRRARGR